MHINEGMKRSDAINKTITSGLEDFLAPHRILMWDGVLDVRMNNSKTKQEIRFVLFNDLLIQVPKSKARDRATLASYESQSSIVSVWIKPSVTAPNAYDLLLPKRLYTIDLKSIEEKDFSAQIQSALSKYFGDPVPFERQCRHTFADGVTYDGRWYEGYMDGAGIFQQQFCGVYEGNWTKGERSGQGKQLWLNGAMYEGQWKDNQPRACPAHSPFVVSNSFLYLQMAGER